MGVTLMTILHESIATCSVCFQEFDVRRAKIALGPRRLKSHEIYQCPHCSYHVAVRRKPLERALRRAALVGVAPRR